MSAAAWDNIHQLKGDPTQRAINDALRGYEFALDCATGAKPITEVWIKELHAVLCVSQDTYAVVTEVGPQHHSLPRGTYKNHPNSPFNFEREEMHGYAPVADTQPEMHRLRETLNEYEFSTLDPVSQAAYAHYAFVCIHPFADGNGRVARALASTFLYRNPGIPLVIFADQKSDYIAALEAADKGQLGRLTGSSVSEL